MIDRDNDEGRGSIFILDRQSLECRYKIDANPEVYWHSKTRFHDEAEEEILDNVVDVRNHLIGFVSGPTIRRSHRTKTFNRELMKKMETRLLELVPQPDQPIHRFALGRFDKAGMCDRGRTQDTFERFPPEF